MSTARTIMFSWLPACLDHSAIPTFLNLARTLAAGTREAKRASGRTSDKGRPPSRSRSPRRAVPLHAARKHDTVLSRAVERSPRSAEDPEGGVSCDIDRDARTVCGRCCGCWSHRQMDWQLGQRGPPSPLEGRRQAQRVLGGLTFRARTWLLERPRLRRGAPSSWYTK